MLVADRGRVQGLRMLIGAAVRVAATRGLALEPVFSIYSPHGPVYRAMLRVQRTAEWPSQHYGEVACTHACGDTVPRGQAPPSAACMAPTSHLRSSQHITSP